MLSHLRPLSMVALVACGAHADGATRPAQPSTASASKPTTQMTAAPAPAPDPRELSGQAHFGDLVRLAQALDSSDKGHSEAGCLLRGTEPLKFEADLSLSVRPLPPAPDHVAEGIGDKLGTVTVMSPWQTLPGDLPDATLLPFTTTSPNAVKRPTLALFATREGAFLRGPRDLLAAPPSALSPDEAGAWLARLNEPAAVYVTADRALDLRRLVEVLKRIPDRHEVALAVALPAGTRLPPPATDSGEGLCEQGLPDPEPGQTEGGLDPRAAQGALAPLRGAALSCALSTGGRALLGGKLMLALRVGKDGRAHAACFVSDEVREPLLRRCLLASVRDLPLPTPSPAGFVDVHVPLQLELAGPKPQRASCQ